VLRVKFAVGAGAVGQRIYMRAVGSAKVEVALGPAGGEPSLGDGVWGIDLKAGTAEKG
jgi:hypothetical protein